jgi:hypothetical protein
MTSGSQNQTEKIDKLDFIKIKPFFPVLSHMWNIDLIQIQQYYEKQVTLRRGQIPEW